MVDWRGEGWYTAFGGRKCHYFYKELDRPACGHRFTPNLPRDNPFNKCEPCLDMIHINHVRELNIAG